MTMKQMTVREFDRLPMIYDNEYFAGIRHLKVGDLYLIKEKDDEVEKGDIISVYEVINKKNDRNIESISVMVKII